MFQSVGFPLGIEFDSWINNFVFPCISYNFTKWWSSLGGKVEAVKDSALQLKMKPEDGLLSFIHQAASDYQYDWKDTAWINYTCKVKERENDYLST